MFYSDSYKYCCIIYSRAGKLGVVSSRALQSRVVKFLYVQNHAATKSPHTRAKLFCGGALMFQASLYRKVHYNNLYDQSCIVLAFTREGMEWCYGTLL